MKKFSAKMWAILLSAVFVMLSTTAVSFAYWKSGITGNSNNSTINIGIGAGSAVETKVSITDNLNLDKHLVPTGKVKDSQTQVDEIKFTFSVRWESLTTLDGANKTNFENHSGELRIFCDAILIDGVDMKNEVGLGYVNSLFVVSFANYHDINGKDPVSVEVTISMNEPNSRQQYQKIADKRMEIVFRFEIESQYDLDSNYTV